MNNDLRNTLIDKNVPVQEQYEHNRPENIVIQTQLTQEGGVPPIQERVAPPIQERGLGGVPLQEGINQLAVDVGHISNLFSDLSILVNCQGEKIDNIQTNIENSSNNIERANRQLIKANKYQMAKSRCMCRCVYFLLITLLILVIIVIIKLAISKEQAPYKPQLR